MRLCHSSIQKPQWNLVYSEQKWKSSQWPARPSEIYTHPTSKLWDPIFYHHPCPLQWVTKVSMLLLRTPFGLHHSLHQGSDQISRFVQGGAPHLNSTHTPALSPVSTCHHLPTALSPSNISHSFLVYRGRCHVNTVNSTGDKLNEYVWNECEWTAHMCEHLLLHTSF